MGVVNDAYEKVCEEYRRYFGNADPEEVEKFYDEWDEERESQKFFSHLILGISSTVNEGLRWLWIRMVIGGGLA